ncbi:PIN domain-containing protein [Bordetella sp. N]|uniref:PIN domain-containing protein n=1 Tax=Bordetella sp. N TaxID=1746199 RepID=UPI00070BBDDA|nr:PIN domain-containing protein [Bordetella sp. N]ALM81633.1 hypothetical protein ASB57_00425 [Bordetella sp. N]
MSIPVVADADTLFAATTRALLIYLDYEGLIKLHWSPLILDEVSWALTETGRKRTLEEARASVTRMSDALPNAMVSKKDVHAQFHSVVGAVRSAKDTHVAACAHCLVAAEAYPGSPVVALVSRNTKDFKKAALAQLGIALHSPDNFLDELTAARPNGVAAAFRRFRLDLASSPTPKVLLERLDRDGLAMAAARLLQLHQAKSATL